MTVRHIRVLLVDDHAIVRQGYRSLLEKQPDITVAGEAANGEDAYRLFQETTPDVVILDITLPGQSGIEVISRLRQRNPRAAILVFTMHQNPLFALQATRAGARAYMTKSSAPELLIRAVYDVYQGRQALSPDIAQALALRKLNGENNDLDQLSPREFEILLLLVETHTTEMIAKLLHISPKTVANSHYEIKRKLNVKTDIELMHLAMKLKIVNLLDVD